MKQIRTILPTRLTLLHKVLLTLSFTVVSTHAATKTVKYTVKHGDSLYKIADKNHTTVEKIQKANGIKKGAVLKLGKVINVPTDRPFSMSKKKSLSKRLLTSLSNSNKFTSVAKTKLGKRYVWGASGRKNTYDCSSFTKYVYRKNGINIPRTSINQSKHGKYVKRCDLKKGDLIFFDTSKKRKGYVNHVGMYIGTDTGNDISVRFNTDGSGHSYSFDLFSSASIQSVQPFEMELNDVLLSGTNQLRIDGRIGVAMDGVDLTLPTGSVLGWMYTHDGMIRTDKVNVSNQALLGRPNAYQLPQTEPYAKPAYDAANDAGVFIWKDAQTGLWHLKASAGGGRMKYKGEIIASVDFLSVQGDSLESHDILDTSIPNRIAFNFNMVKQWIGDVVHIHQLHLDDYPYQQLFNLLSGIDFNGYLLLEDSRIPDDRIAAMKEQLAVFNEKMSKYWPISG